MFLGMARNIYVNILSKTGGVTVPSSGCPNGSAEILAKVREGECRPCRRSRGAYAHPENEYLHAYNSE